MGSFTRDLYLNTYCMNTVVLCILHTLSDHYGVITYNKCVCILRIYVQDKLHLSDKTDNFDLLEDFKSKNGHQNGLSNHCLNRTRVSSGECGCHQKITEHTASVLYSKPKKRLIEKKKEKTHYY